jgi:cellulose synthase/poly-beta-1,6-N-acetylglucosamine synthase-like glycosyltransferase
MAEDIPKISVGMPVYNGESFVEVAIQSILRQTFDDFELIICDNASTDRTAEICQDFQEQDRRVTYHRNEKNLGAAGNYARVFKLSRAPYFRWANADDISGERLHECCLRTLEANPDAVLAYGKTQMIDENGRVTGDYDDNLNLQQTRASDRFFKYVLSVGFCNVIYGLMRRSAVANTHLMGDGSLAAADIRLIAELVLQGMFIEIPEVLFYRRMHETASSWDKADRQRQITFWSAGQKRLILPNWRKNLGYLRGALTLPLDLSERRRIALFILRRMVRQRRMLARDLVELVRQSA